MNRHDNPPTFSRKDIVTEVAIEVSMLIIFGLVAASWAGLLWG